MQEDHLARRSLLLLTVWASNHAHWEQDSNVLLHAKDLTLFGQDLYFICFSIFLDRCHHWVILNYVLTLNLFLVLLLRLRLLRQVDLSFLHNKLDASH